MSGPGRILVCTCRQAGLVEPERAQELLRERTNAGDGCVVVEDLCGLAATDREGLRKAMEGVEEVAACRPRAVRWLLDWAGVRGAEKLKLTNMLAARAAAKAMPQGQWTPWFPVIDYDRCTGCGQCLEFCLFDVYARDGEGVQVARPSHCKTNCPACARVCPEAAIIFPKYSATPFNGEPVPADFRGGAALDQLARDPHAALRGRERFSTGAPDADAAAAALDIPPEVLASPDAQALRARLTGSSCPCQRPDDEPDGEKSVRGRH